MRLGEIRPTAPPMAVDVDCGAGGLVLGVSASPAPVRPRWRPRTTTTPATLSWTVYHHDPQGSGVVTGVASVIPGQPGLDARPRSTDPCTGSLSSMRGASSWPPRTTRSPPSRLPPARWSGRPTWPLRCSRRHCPVGTSRPRWASPGRPSSTRRRGEIFVVADEEVDGRPAHMLVGLATSTGGIEMTEDVDPPGADTAALLQRTGLTLDSGRVVFGFGGNYGDCSNYRGWVVGVPEGGGTPVDFAVDSGSGESQGAVWMGGAAPAVDSGGDVWVGVGNGSVTTDRHAYDDSDSVLELSPSLQLEQYFAPSSWPSDNAHDLDLSMEPVLLADGQVVIAGKARIVYLLDGRHLGGIGGQQASLGAVCSDDVDGGSATVGTTVFLPCLSGIVAVNVGASPPGLGWRGAPDAAAALRSWRPVWSGPSVKTVPCTGSIRSRAPSGSRPPSARRPTTFLRRVWVTGCWWPHRPIVWWPSRPCRRRPDLRQSAPRPPAASAAPRPDAGDGRCPAGRSGGRHRHRRAGPGGRRGLARSGAAAPGRSMKRSRQARPRAEGQAPKYHAPRKEPASKATTGSSRGRTIRGAIRRCSSATSRTTVP